MVDQNLLNYIQEAQGQGMTKEQITQQLMRVGWQLAMIVDGFNALQSNSSIPVIPTANIPSTSQVITTTDSRKISPQLIRRFLIGGASLVIIGIAFFIFKNKIFQPKNNSEIQQVVNQVNEIAPPPFLQFDNEMKLADYKDNYLYYEVIYNKNKTCFAVVVELKHNPLASDTPNPSGFGPISLNTMVFFKDTVVGPVRLDTSPSQDFKFSNDCSTLVFKAIDNQDGLYKIYKNGVIISAQSNQSYYFEFNFDPKSKRVFYVENNNFFVDGTKEGSYNSGGVLSLQDGASDSLKFSNSNNSYAFKVMEHNPEFQTYLNNNAKVSPWGDNVTLNKIMSDKTLTDEEKTKNIDAAMEKMSPKEMEKLMDIISSPASMIEQFQLEEEFEKTNWVNRQFLVVDGKMMDSFSIIHDFMFTDSGDLRYIASKSDGDYFFHDGKLEKIETYTPSSPTRKSYRNLRSSPDGKRYSYGVVTYKTPDPNFFSKLGNETEAEKQFAEIDEHKDRYKIVVDGKISEEYVGYPMKNLVFSPDSKHIAYTASLDGESKFVYYDDKKLGPFSNIVTGNNDSIFTFSPDNKLYFNSQDSNEACLYIEGQKNNCQKGNFTNFTFQGSSFAYVYKYIDETNTGKYKVIFNDNIYGPYDGFDNGGNFLMSPDNSKLLFLTEDGIYLNGELLHLRTPYGNIHDELGFFTPDSQHVVYSNEMANGIVEIRADKDKIVDTINTSQEVFSDKDKTINKTDIWEEGPMDLVAYMFPAPDKKSVWYIFNDKNTKQLMIKNIKLGL